ncbi:hypothetical protein IAG44_40030 [Streptomyces roseirectus]|uniref:Uncharacterized protein n=1 Tax=Streptomyces roseirectus TaxID=2768066 RepID=A0A7H0IQD3_9ACTN|nr:hypothetical protein [Streptomyces roseirectus]QNP74999.1 hypothetical protein IAG44_40030 [Streptomyces roseirectus]
MNNATERLVSDVVRRLERAVHERTCPAVVALQGEARTLVLSDYDYLRDEPTAQAFEQRAAQKAREIDAGRFAIAVPQVWLFTGEAIYSRAVANLPLRENEVELIAWMSFDPDDGVDYGYLPYSRRPSGEPVFDDDAQTVITAPVQPYPKYPGQHLLQALTEDR